MAIQGQLKTMLLVFFPPKVFIRVVFYRKPVKMNGKTLMNTMDNWPGWVLKDFFTKGWGTPAGTFSLFFVAYSSVCFLSFVCKVLFGKRSVLQRWNNFHSSQSESSKHCCEILSNRFLLNGKPFWEKKITGQQKILATDNRADIRAQLFMVEHHALCRGWGETSSLSKGELENKAEKQLEKFLVELSLGMILWCLPLFSWAPSMQTLT